MPAIGFDGHSPRRQPRCLAIWAWNAPIAAFMSALITLADSRAFSRASV